MSEIDYGDRKLADEQMRKAAVFFGRVLEAHKMGKLAARVGDVVIVVARGEASIAKLEHLLTAEALGSFLPEGFSFGGELPTEEKESRDSAGSTEITGSTGSPGSQTSSSGSQTEESLPSGDPGEIVHEGDVLLVPRYHVPGSQTWAGSGGRAVGNVHLHVTADVKLGRRSRRRGECLCSKKKGSYERPPEGETKMCEECVKVATDNGLGWSL